MTDPNPEDLARENEALKRRVAELEAERDTLFRSARAGIVLHDADLRVLAWNPRMEALTGVPEADIVGKLPTDVFPFLEDVGLMDHLREALTRSVPPIEYTDPSKKRARVGSTTILLPGANKEVLGLASFVDDITVRKELERKHDEVSEALDRRTVLVESLFAAARAVLHGGDFRDTARQVFDTTRKLWGIRAGFITLFGDDGEEREIIFFDPGEGISSVAPRLERPPRALCDLAVRTKGAVVQNDFASSEWAAEVSEGHLPISNVLLAALTVDGKVIGLMALANKPDDFTEEDRSIAEGLANLAAIAFQNASHLEALQTSEEHLRLATDGAGFGTYAWDAATGKVRCSPGLLALYGLPEGATIEMGADGVPAAVHPSDRTRFQAAYRAAADPSGSRLFEAEYRIQRTDNAWRWLHVRGRTIFSSDGTGPRLERAHGVVYDVTAERHAAERLELLKTSIDIAPTSTYWVNREGLIVYANEVGYKSLGYTQEEILTLHLSDISPSATKETWATVWPSIKAGVWVTNVVHRRKDGTEFPVELTSILITQGEQEYCFGTAVDLTERRKAEMERARLQEQLLQAQKMESVGRLAGGVAHDFNNMLTIIQFSVEEALEQLGPGEPIVVCLREIERAAARSASLTRQLLAFARKQTIAPRVLDLNETIRGMLKMLGRLLGENLELEFHPDPALWSVMLDPSQIDQLLANLCVNARDAIPDVGRVVIETHNKRLAEKDVAGMPDRIAGDYVELVVSDDGCGMDEETMSHLFEPFFTTKVVGKGTGLGLATVYGIVRQNGGFVDVFSTPGKGTTFRIFLPHDSSRSDSDRPSAPFASKRGRETILVVEDEPPILRLISRGLSQRGYRVLEAQTPREALQQAKQHQGRIDLVLADVVMPQMNGRELVEHLLLLRPHLHCLFMSGYTADAIAHHGVLAAGVSFIEKPFSVEKLAAKVRQILG